MWCEIRRHISLHLRKGYLRFWAGDSGEQGVTRETAVIFSL
jgi:hypothetical protein